MRRSVLIAAVLAGAVLGAAACSTSPTPEPLPTSFAVRVPTVPAAGACRGVGLIGATLAGDTSDPRVTWLDTPGGRLDLVWPLGYTARFFRFASPFEILDADGRVVHRQGDSISGACVAGPANDPASILLIDLASP